jgi:hypothetical protein
MSADHDYSGDYGYDLVNEVRFAPQMPSVRSRLTPVRGLRAASRELDPDGDFGYDQAHEL